MIQIGALPAGHPLRSRVRLAGAQVRNLGSPTWKTVDPHWGIAKSCYDALRGPWLEFNEFCWTFIQGET